MKRQDRLIALLLALQQRNETAGSLAEKFEVSNRTIIRDIQALSEMGVPLYSESGPSGGYRLMSGYRLPPLNLESGEALALFFSLKALQGYSDTPFNQERWTLLDKLAAILPENTLERMEPLLSRVEMEVPKRHYRTPLLSELIRHAAEAQCLEVAYRSQSGAKTVLLRPERIYAANGFWYCDAYSWTHGENRLFRVDRMDSLHPVTAPAIAPEQEPEEKKQALPPLRIRARLSYRGMLQIERDRHIGECITFLGEDVWETDFSIPSTEWDWLIRLFYSLGPDAEVLEPASLRDEIRERALQVANRYEQPPQDDERKEH
ncbi:helix-turn-helix transcriptional regulator [Gorillibacterium timonense]|uniref:helix-turn-helix transcriptional regulator n=1 Tax=Gorillibacterium timonense TaxID=1689269 RepID=UPI00071CD361|nr:YafY family protein [Gorillibacterium timonense]